MKDVAGRWPSVEIERANVLGLVRDERGRVSGGAALVGDSAHVTHPAGAARHEPGDLWRGRSRR